jgi:hypothetical protein
MLQNIPLLATFFGDPAAGTTLLVERLVFDGGHLRARGFRDDDLSKLVAERPSNLFMRYVERHIKGSCTIASVSKQCSVDEGLLVNLVDDQSYRDVLQTSHADVFCVCINEKTLGRKALEPLLAFRVPFIVVVVSKMDLVSRQESFEETKRRVLEMVESMDTREKCIVVLPVSALDAENLSKHSDKLGFWTGQLLVWKGISRHVRSMYDCFRFAAELRDAERAALSTGPVRFYIDGVYRIKGVGDLVTGVLVSGRLQKQCKGDKHLVVPRFF